MARQHDQPAQDFINIAQALDDQMLTASILEKLISRGWLKDDQLHFEAQGLCNHEQQKKHVLNLLSKR